MLHPNDKEAATARSVKLYPKQLRSLLSGLQATAMDADALAKLPRSTIEAAMRLQADQQVLLLSVEHWIDFVESGRSDWISPEALFEHWQQLRRLLASAHRLQETMISASVVSKAEADQLFTRQLANSAMHSLSGIVNKPKIEAAQQYFSGNADEA